LIHQGLSAIIPPGPTGKEVPLDELLRDVAAGIIAGLLVHWIVRRFL